jgi:hypothetical protein
VPSLDSVGFDDTGLTYDGERDGMRVWLTSSGDSVILHYFPIPPDIAADLHDLADLRQFYRTAVAGAGGAIIEVETLTVGDCLAVRQIVKAPQQPSGMMYLGSITLPYRSFSFVLKVQCPEYGTTGVRDTLVLHELMRQGQVTIDPERPLIMGWFRDPYDPTLIDGFRKNLSEDDVYDARFPHHPLSRLRPLLTRLQCTIQLADDVRGQPSFAFKRPRRHRWWQR